MTTEDTQQEDWYQALRNTWFSTDNALRNNNRDDERVIEAMKRAVQALTDVATECVVTATELDLQMHEEKARRCRSLLNSLGRLP